MSSAGVRKVIGTAAVGAVVLAIAGGLWMLGSPSEGRARQLDRRRESDVQRLQLATDLYWTRNRRLPTSLEELARDAGTDVYSRDPVSAQPYEYRVLETAKYELCAAFDRASSESYQGFWSHGPGKRCFQVAARTIRP